MQFQTALGQASCQRFMLRDNQGENPDNQDENVVAALVPQGGRSPT
jgi:hypothetical protein